MIDSLIVLDCSYLRLHLPPSTNCFQPDLHTPLSSIAHGNLLPIIYDMSYLNSSTSALPLGLPSSTWVEKTVDDKCIASSGKIDLEERQEQNEVACRERSEREEIKRLQYKPHGLWDPRATIGTGVQILAESSDDLEQGFKFPYWPLLGVFDISWCDWERVAMEILGNFKNDSEVCGGGRFHHRRMHNYRIHTIAKNIEYVLDNVAEQDKAFFRPRGLIMRMDMPGEQKFGLDLMDLYYGSSRYGLPRKLHRIAMDSSSSMNCLYPNCSSMDCLHTLGASRYCSVCRRLPMHVRHIRKKFFRGTRIVISPLTILEDPNVAYRHGWTNWIQQCEAANANKSTEEPAPILNLVALSGLPTEEINRVEDEYFEALDAYFQPLMKRPLSERIFRWPPSKQIYYDRWRGHSDIYLRRVRVYPKGHAKRRYLPLWIPWEDSMDKRMKTQWTPKCVVPADDFEATVMEWRCIPKDKCSRKRKPKIVTHEERKRDCTTREEEIKFEPLESERVAAKRYLHHCSNFETPRETYTELRTLPKFCVRNSIDMPDLEDCYPQR
jgi:hypothetical protein